MRTNTYACLHCLDSKLVDGGVPCPSCGGPDAKPAPLPEDISWELRELAAYAGKNPNTPLSFIYDRIVLTITGLTRRLAEVEAHQCEICKKNEIERCRSEARVRELEQQLADANECLTIAHMDGYHKGQKAGQSEHNNSVRMGQYILEAKTEKRMREAAEARVAEQDAKLADAVTMGDANGEHGAIREAAQMGAVAIRCIEYWLVKDSTPEASA